MQADPHLPGPGQQSRLRLLAAISNRPPRDQDGTYCWATVSSARLKLIWLFLALACGCVVGGCAGSGASIPPGVALIRVTSARGREPSFVGVRVTDPSNVRQITAWIDQMKPVPRGAYSCPFSWPTEPTVSFTFRASSQGPALARASETDDGSGSGPCNPLTVRIGGQRHHDLVAGRFLERVQRLLKVNLGFGYGEIVGSLSPVGGRPLPPVVRARLPEGTASGYYVNLSVADARAFHGGGGSFIGFPVNRSGQFRSQRLPAGAYLLDWAKGQQKPDCPPTKVIVRVHHTTPARVPVGCTAK
jgi:hypothetical protein